MPIPFRIFSLKIKNKLDFPWKKGKALLLEALNVHTYRTLCPWGWCCKAAKKWHRWAWWFEGCFPPTAPSAEVALPRLPLLPWLPLWWLYKQAWSRGWSVVNSCKGISLVSRLLFLNGRYTPYWLSVSESSPSEATGDPESLVFPGPPHMAFLSILFSCPMVGGSYDGCEGW